MAGRRTLTLVDDPPESSAAPLMIKFSLRE